MKVISVQFVDLHLNVDRSRNAVRSVYLIDLYEVLEMENLLNQEFQEVRQSKKNTT